MQNQLDLAYVKDHRVLNTFEDSLEIRAFGGNITIQQIYALKFAIEKAVDKRRFCQITSLGPVMDMRSTSWPQTVRDCLSLSFTERTHI